MKIFLIGGIGVSLDGVIELIKQNNFQVNDISVLDNVSLQMDEAYTYYIVDNIQQVINLNINMENVLILLFYTYPHDLLLQSLKTLDSNVVHQHLEEWFRETQSFITLAKNNNSIYKMINTIDCCKYFDEFLAMLSNNSKNELSTNISMLRNELIYEILEQNKEIQGCYSELMDNSTLFNTSLYYVKRGNAYLLESELNIKQEQIGKLESELNTKQGQIDTLELGLNTKQEQIDKLELGLNTKQEQVDKLELGLNTKQEQIGKLESELNTKQGQIDKLESELNTKQEQVDKLELGLNTRQEQVDKLESELNTKQEQVDKLESELNIKQEQIDKLNSELESSINKVNLLKNEFIKYEWHMDLIKDLISGNDNELLKL